MSTAPCRGSRPVSAPDGVAHVEEGGRTGPAHIEALADLPVRELPTAQPDVGGQRGPDGYSRPQADDLLDGHRLLSGAPSELRRWHECAPVVPGEVDDAGDAPILGGPRDHLRGQSPVRWVEEEAPPGPQGGSRFGEDLIDVLHVLEDVR